MKTKEIYQYEVIHPIKDYGFNKNVGDLMTRNELLSLPPMYKKYVKDLPSPIVK
jgi:hypothetical protein